MPPFVSESDMRRQLGRSGKDATTVVADYLREIYRHTMEELANTYGQMFMKTTKLQFVLTVPAVWSDGAKNATLVAAQRAGIGPDLITISEPEAAAIYTLQAVPYLKKADNFILVDCGGGTVDLISYVGVLSAT
jgi:molecular chaperone DnaK (HSP70)